MKGRSLIIAIAAAVAIVGAGAGTMIGAHAVGAVSQYVFAPKPIAPTGSLAAGQSVPVTVTAEDSTGTAVPGATVYLVFLSGGGSASVGTTSLTSISMPFVADSSGKISITYTASQAPLPTTGHDKIVAKNAPNKATIVATDSYLYSPVKKYVMRPTPIATTGTLAGGATVNVTLTAIASGGGSAPGVTVYLSFTQATGGGSATVGSTTLTSTPTAFVASSAGTIAIVYHAPATPPTTGTDTVKAQNTATRASVSATDTYTF